MTQTHTPGPWSYEYDNDTGPNDEGFWQFYRIDAAKANVGQATTESDARLIAAAPDMLAALQAAMNVMRSDPHAREARAIVQAAIAKATS